MGMFNSILSRLIGNKKQREAAEMLAGMVNGKDGEQQKGIQSIKLTNGAANGFYLLTLSNEAGDEVYSQVKIYGATDKYAGIMTAADKKKLDGISDSNIAIHKIKFHNSMSGSEQFSSTVNFTDVGLNEGVSSAFENIYIIPLYGNSGELDNGILPVPLLPLKELLLMGEYIHCEINPNVSDQLICQKMVITAQSRFNPNQEEDEFWYTGLKLEIFNMTFENIPK